MLNNNQVKQLNQNLIGRENFNYLLLSEIKLINIFNKLKKLKSLIQKIFFIVIITLELETF